MNFSNLKRYFAEAAMIIFSVLFALFINKCSDNAKTNQQKNVAIESIKKEITQNAAILDRWQTNHSKIQMRLMSLLEGKEDSLMTALKAQKYLNLGLLTGNETLIDAFLSNTAWETVKTTNIIAEFDFETLERLTQVYSLQEVIMDKTTQKILNLYFSREAQDLSQLEPTLLQFFLLFSELVGQENLLIELYGRIDEKITL